MRVSSLANVTFELTFAKELTLTNLQFVAVDSLYSKRLSISMRIDVDAVASEQSIGHNDNNDFMAIGENEQSKRIKGAC